MNKIIGIDPGRTGALAVINSSSDILLLADLPGRVTELANLLSQFSCHDYCAIEKPFVKTNGDAAVEFPKLVRKMPLLANYHEIRGILLANGVKFLDVAPRSWQATFKVRGKSKGQNSVAQASALFGAAELIGRNHGRSDALLIAEWRRLQLVKQKRISCTKSQKPYGD